MFKELLYRIDLFLIRNIHTRKILNYIRRKQNKFPYEPAVIKINYGKNGYAKPDEDWMVNGKYSKANLIEPGANITVEDYKFYKI